MSVACRMAGGLCESEKYYGFVHRFGVFGRSFGVEAQDRSGGNGDDGHYNTRGGQTN